ncbi:hypothetical protein JTE90_006874 [Oedothorax gibbosus]|uniref:Uncharacterized protein n=1 Tax=Oedothorax gibbosus TaxID=931172 RepID=A0AAV6TK13_9ARAC|nr:hypothetical protein JTE90_006874 [Oedothorax gibbosus]
MTCLLDNEWLCGLDVNTRRCYGHSLEDLIQRCSFNSVTCDSKDFAYFYSKQYGNCLTFNRQTENDINTKHRIVKRTGPQSGLELALEAELSYYSPITPSTGFRVIIHSPQEDPHPSRDGVNIPVGSESYLSLVKTSFHRLPSPYRDVCKNYPPNGELNCINDCLQRVSMELCGCVDPFLVTRPKTVPCNLINETQTACMSRVLDLLSSKVTRCDCPLSCFSTEYDVLLQSMATNWTRYLRHFSDDTAQFGRYYDPRVCWSYIPNADRSETKLKVYFRTLDHTTHAQKPMYSDSEFFSHLGGQMSLWLGLSFISFYEFSEKLFILMIRRALRRRFSE